MNMNYEGTICKWRVIYVTVKDPAHGDHGPNETLFIGKVKALK